MTEPTPEEIERWNRRMQKVQKRMRQVFFHEFGVPKKNAPNGEAQADAAIAALACLHAGELVETAARFGDAKLGLRDRVMAIVDAFIESNLEELAEVVGDADKFAYLMRAPKREGSATQ